MGCVHVFIEYGYLNFAPNVQYGSLSNPDLDFAAYVLHRRLNTLFLLDVFRNNEFSWWSILISINNIMYCMILAHFYGGVPGCSE